MTVALSIVASMARRGCNRGARRRRSEWADRQPCDASRAAAIVRHRAAIARPDASDGCATSSAQYLAQASVVYCVLAARGRLDQELRADLQVRRPQLVPVLQLGDRRARLPRDRRQRIAASAPGRSVAGRRRHRGWLRRVSRSTSAAIVFAVSSSSPDDARASSAAEGMRGMIKLRAGGHARAWPSGSSLRPGPCG